MHRFRILANMSRLALSQVEQAFFRNAAGGVQGAWRLPAGGDVAKPSEPALEPDDASRLRNQAALKHQETAGRPSPVWTVKQAERRIREKPTPPVRLVQTPFGH